MNIIIQSVAFDATEKLKEFATKKVTKLERFSEDIVSADVIMKVVKPEVANNKEASIKLHVAGSELFASKVGDSFEEAIDLCVDALEKQLMKVKEKNKN